MEFDWDVAWDAMPDLLRGLWVAVQATLIGYAIALVLGLVFAILRRSRSRWISAPTALVVEFIRSTPLLVQLFFLFFVLPGWGISFSALVTGSVGLGIHYATYTSEVYRAGIDGVPVGQWEAARALNLSPSRTWTAVILPQAVPRAIPALGNYLIAAFKDTPQLTAITVGEMLSTSIERGSKDYHFLEPITMAGLLYLAVALVMAYLMRLVERRFGTVRAG